MSDTNVGTVSIDLQLDDGPFNRALTAAETKAAVTGKTIDSELSGATSRTEARFASFGSVATKALGATGIAAGVAGFAAIKMSGDFEQSLNVFQSVSGATAKQMELVAAKARELGQDASLPGISARDAALALTELAKAGLDVNQSLAASKGVLSLAKAGNLGVADAAAIAAKALNAFGLEGTQAVKVADLLAAAANASTAGVDDIALGLAQVGAGAKQMGVGLGDTITSLALFANAGIRGQDAGTSLKQMFIQLATPTKQASELMKKLGLDFFDAKGNFIGLEQTSAQLQTKLKKLTQEQRNNALATIFGSDSMRVAAILADQGATGFDKMAKAVSKQGAATELAAAQNKGFTGALDNFISTLQTVGIDLGTKVLPPLTAFLKVMAQDLPPVVDFAVKHGHDLAVAALAIGSAFAAIRIAGFVSDLSSAQKTLDLFIGTKNATGIRAIGDALVAIGGGVKAAALKIADIAVAAGTAAADTSKAGATAAAGWVTAAARTIKAWLVAFASMIGTGAKTAARLTAQGALAAAGWIGSAARASAAWVAAFIVIVTKSFWAGLKTSSPATAAALAWTANAIKISAVWTAQFAIIVTRAILTGALIAAQAFVGTVAWVGQGAIIATSYVASFAFIVLKVAAAAAFIVAQAVFTTVAWVGQGVLIAAGWTAQLALLVIRTAATAVLMAAQAAVITVAWVGEAAIATGAWILRMVAMLPFAIGWAIGMVVQAGIVSAGWIAAAAVSAAAWIAANLVMFGVFALIAVAVVAIVAFIITHFDQVKKFPVGVWDGLKDGVAAAFNIGRDLITGIVQGLASSAGAVVNKIKEICASALNAVKAFFGIHSPSTVMAGMGENLMKGLAQGIAGAGAQATAAMKAVSADLLGALSVPSGSFSLTGDSSAGVGMGATRSVTQHNQFTVNNGTDPQLIANEIAWRAARAA